ncbi:MAG: TonB-dependent receptor [Bacteroidales bacterium]|nr:TonB-dependent receptor [Bacteroidales bacterium]
MKIAIKPLFIAFLFVIISSFFSILIAQETVSGTVTDAETGDAIIGATVLLKGSTTGSITDIEGYYSISVTSRDDVLRFSYVGYVTQEIQVNGNSVIDVQLEVDRTQLDEVVVIGYGTQKKTDLTGSVTVVDAEEMQRSTYNTLDKALQGRAAGVHITAVSGKPGDVSSIKIRGIGSISRSSEPLIIVDGMPVGTDYMNALNPADVESLQVLKDASATAIYGARGANGVILITTQRGTEGTAKVSFTANTGISQLTSPFDLMNASQYAEFYEAVYRDYAKDDPKNMYYQVYSDSARTANDNLDTDTDWQNEVTRIGVDHDYNLSVSGGSENSSYYVAGNYSANQGIVVDTDMKRYGLTANSNFKVSDRITMGESFSFSKVAINDVSNYGNGNPFYVSTVTSPLMPVYDPGALGGYGGPTDTLTGINERTNPVAEQMLNVVQRDRYKVLTSIYMDAKLLPGLVYTVRIGGSYSINYDKEYNPEYTLGNMRLRDRDFSKLSESNSYTENLQMNHQLSYAKNFGDHNLNLIAVWERFSGNWKYNSASGTDIAHPDLVVLDQTTANFIVNGRPAEHRLESYLARVQYDYAGKYLLTASYRVDGSSRFGPEGGRFGHFPSFSAGWKINEDLLQNVDEINMLKLRFGWGITGNENLDDYQYFNLIDPKVNSRYIFGENQDLYLAGAPTSFQANPLIKWEEARMANFGIDMNAFRNRLQVTAEYYIKNQNDLLVQKPISRAFGKYSAYGAGGTVGAWANLSKVQNRGLEFTGSWKKREGDFHYAVTANFSTIRNEVIDLIRDEIVTNYTITTEGFPIGSFYGFVAERILQVDDFDEAGNYLHAKQEKGTSPGDIKFKDLNNDGVINNDDRTIIGKPIPDMIYGINITADYRGLDLTLFLQGMQNMQVYNTMMAHIGMASGDNTGKDENKLVDVMNYWTPENGSTTMTRPTVLDENLNSRISNWFLYEASFLRIKTLQIGYSFPERALSGLNINQFRIYASANNLFTITRYPGYDPEIGSTDPLNMGIDNGYYPVPRTASIGINLTF